MHLALADNAAAWKMIFVFSTLMPIIMRNRTAAKSLDDFPLEKSKQLLAMLVVQDFLAAAQIALIAGLIGALPISLIVAGLLAAAWVSAAHVLFFFDDALLKHFNCRFSLHFFSYVGQLPLFVESSKKLGMDLRLVTAGGFAYFTALAVLFAAGFTQWGKPSGLGVAAIALVGTILCGIATLRRIPPELAVRHVNPILFRQGELLRSRRERPPAEPEKVVATFLHHEEFSLADRARPALRRTERYTGERHFELNLKSGQRPDVIFLFLESFCAEPIGVIDGETGASPEFNALSREGILFRNFYGNGVQTARAVMSSLFGIPPRLTEMPAQSDLRRGPKLIGLPHFFAERGYRNAYLHNGSLAFEAQNLFFPRQRYDELHGFAEIQRQFPEAAKVGGWGVPDEYLMRYFADWLAGQREGGRPTFSTLFTMTNHHPFEVPPGFTPPVFHFPGNPEKEMFLGTFAYTDYCLRLLVNLLQEKGLYENTLLFVLADTSQPLGRHDNWVEQKFLFEDNLRIPLLILGPDFVRAPMAVEEPSSQLDLLPTVLDLFGGPFTQHSFGSSLARVRPERRIYCNNPFGNQWLAERRGPLKIIHEIRTDKTQLFDLHSDPLETNDLAKVHGDLTARWREELLRMNEVCGFLYRTNRFC